MSTPRLEETILSGTSVRSPYYFNGRLLSAEDLAAEHAASLARERSLGRALGTGISHGLEVRLVETPSGTTSTVSVTKGLALNRCGHAVELCEDISLILEKPAASAGEQRGGSFSVCTAVPPGTGPSRAGAYVLTIFPFEKREGRAPVSGLGNELAPCNAKQLASGVRFRLVEIDTAGLASDDLTRNRLAWRCLGLGKNDLLAYLRHPAAGSLPDYGIFGELGAGRLVESEVPLAVVYWSAPGALEFLDSWSVRRRLIRREIAAPWSYYADDRRRAEAEAGFLQFQDHLRDVQTTAANPATVQASDHFEMLPPLGLLPAGGSQPPAGFDPATFFGAAASDPALLEAADLRALFQESLHHEPFTLTGTERLQLYVVRESFEAALADLSSGMTVVFASPLLPYRGRARFNISRFNHSYFSSHIL